MPLQSEQPGHAGLTGGQVTELHLHQAVIEFVINDGGTVIVTGRKGWLSIPFDCEIKGWVLLPDQVGSISVDVRKSTFADWPTTVSIVGTEKPGLTLQGKNQDSALTTWATSILAGDVLEYIVDGAAPVNVKIVTLALDIEK